MNPILLKSGGRRESDGAYLCSVFVLGQHLATEDFGALGRRTDTLLDLVVQAYQRLPASVVILEGAGSCTELNLMERDVVNLPLVRRLQSKWVLVANIDPGGVFAQVVGTKACLSEADWDLCVGVIINKLRGDVKYFEPGPRMLQEMVGKPIFVVPYLCDIDIAEEDGMGLERKLAQEHAIEETALNDTARVVVVCYPHISMMDDVLPLEQDSRFRVEWRRNHLPRQVPRAIILPGSRQTRVDMDWLSQSPWYKYLIEFAGNGGKVLGLCGGYQMLGKQIEDSSGIESGKPGVTRGLGFLPVSTILEHSKVVRDVKSAALLDEPSISVTGFEIHSGNTLATDSTVGMPLLQMMDGQSLDGWRWKSVAGTYLHGILESPAFRQWFFGVPGTKEAASCDPLDRLAEHLIAHGLDARQLAAMIGLPRGFD